jgi:hypothetical protein
VRLRLAGVAAAAGGALVFAWSIRAAGTTPVVDGVRRLGAGFIVVLILGGVRHLARATAWRLCLDSPADLTFGSALAAYLAGDAIGNVTPFGLLISEPSKIVLVRRHVTGSTSIPALALENLFYSATVVVMLIAGTAALLLSFPLSSAIRGASIATLGAAMGLAAAAVWIVWTRRAIISRLLDRAGLDGSRARDVENRVFDFAGRHRDRLAPIAALEVGYHVAAIGEIWLVLRWIAAAHPSLLIAFVLEYVNRAITVAFQFVPLWLGVDEAGTGGVTAALGLGAAAGVSLALVRKARILVWTGAGFALLAFTPRASSTAQSPAQGSRVPRPPAPAPLATGSPVPPLSGKLIAGSPGSTAAESDT